MNTTPHIRIAALGACCALAHVTDATGQESTSFLRLVDPPSSMASITKKPRIRVAIDVPYVPESVFVTLDGVDISSQVEMSDSGLTFSPRQVLAGGDHVLTVSLRSRDELDLQQEFRFSTRHAQAFMQLSNRVRVGLEVEQLADRAESAAPDPSYRAQGELNHGLALARDRWESRVETNLWYLNQKLPVAPPPAEGVDLASFRLQASRLGDVYRIGADLGDIQINGTRNTFGALARRGGTLGFGNERLAFTGFAVNSQRVFGFRGGTGLGTDLDSNLFGLTTGVGLLDNKLRFDAVHARGGEPGSSFGLFTAGGSRRGRVTGYVVTARPLPSFELQAELDQSSFDDDITDQLDAREDEAWSIRASGQKRIFNYQLTYEHLGPDYAVVASSVQSDQENIAASGGIQLNRHSLTVTALHQHDNLDARADQARRANREWALDYGFFAGQRWFLSAGYRDSRVASSLEPEGFAPMEMLTRGWNGRVQYANGPWLVGLDVMRSDQDDAFSDLNDSTILTRAFSPAYRTAHFSIQPLISSSTTRFRGTGMEIEQTNASLMLNGQLAQERIGYGLSVSATGQESSDGSFDFDTRSAEVRLSYHLRRMHEQVPRAIFSLRATRLESIDRIGSVEMKDWTVWLTATVNAPFEF